MKIATTRVTLRNGIQHNNSYPPKIRYIRPNARALINRRSSPRSSSSTANRLNSGPRS